MALTVSVLAAACTTSPVTGPPPVTTPTAPVINGFVAITKRSEAPVTAVLEWSVSDANGDSLTCRIDTDGDNVLDRTVNSCANSGSILVQYDTAGTRQVRLEVDDGTFAPVAAAAAVVVAPGPAESFEITLNLAPDMAPEYREAFESAAVRWSEVIRSGLPDQPLMVPEGFLGWMPAFDGVVDDVLIMARDIEMDGPRGTLGQAGALLTRDFSGHPYLGMMQFDTADLERMATSGRLQDLILHEMGHVLGMGSNWLLEGLIDDALSDPRYNGSAGVAAWRELGGTGRVPVENLGGVGTAFAHWRESTFNNELMTGYLDDDEPLSRLTIAAMVDRGYGVDLSAADAYALPVAGLRLGGGAEAVAGESHTDPVMPYPGNRLPGV